MLWDMNKGSWLCSNMCANFLLWDLNTVVGGTRKGLSCSRLYTHTCMENFLLWDMNKGLHMYCMTSLLLSNIEVDKPHSSSYRSPTTSDSVDLYHLCELVQIIFEFTVMVLRAPKQSLNSKGSIHKHLAPYKLAEPAANGVSDPGRALPAPSSLSFSTWFIKLSQLD